MHCIAPSSLHGITLLHQACTALHCWIKLALHCIATSSLHCTALLHQACAALHHSIKLAMQVTSDNGSVTKHQCTTLTAHSLASASLLSEACCCNIGLDTYDMSKLCRCRLCSARTAVLLQSALAHMHAVAVSMSTEQARAQCKSRPSKWFCFCRAQMRSKPQTTIALETMSRPALLLGT